MTTDRSELGPSFLSVTPSLLPDILCLGVSIWKSLQISFPCLLIGYPNCRCINNIRGESGGHWANVILLTYMYTAKLVTDPTQSYHTSFGTNLKKWLLLEEIFSVPPLFNSSLCRQYSTIKTITTGRKVS